MVKSSSMEKLRAAFAELVADNGGATKGVSLDDVCKKAKVSRATAYRSDPGKGQRSFKSEFDVGHTVKGRSAPSKAVVAVGDDDGAESKALASKMANRLQAMAVELERERTLRRRETQAATVPGGGKILLFPEERRPV